MYTFGLPAVIVNRDPTARFLAARARRARGGGGLGDAETEADCAQPVSTAERDALREELGKYAGWGPGTYEQWHEGHPDLRAALDDIGGRMKGLYDRPKLLRCDKEARNRASTWIQQLRQLLSNVKSAPNHGWDASGFTRVSKAFDWSFYRGPTYHIRSTSDPNIARTMHEFCVATWSKLPASSGGGPHACDDSPPGWAAIVAAGTPTAITHVTSPTGPTGAPVPVGAVVAGGTVYASSADERAAAAAAGGAGVTPTTGGSVPSAGGLPSFAMPSFLEGSIAGVPTKYLALVLVGYMLLKRR